MEIVPQLTSGHILRYRRSNGAWIEYRVYNYKPICFTHRNTSVSFVYAENTDPNATPEEKFVVFLEYQQNYDDFLVSLKYFTPKLHHQILPRQTRIFVVNSTEANHQFLLSNNGRWHFLQAPNLLARIQFHYEEEPTLIPTPGFYVPKTLLGIPAPLLVEPLPKNQPVLPVPLPRPSSQPRVNPGPRQERADSDAVCITNPGKISLFELQNRLKTFINEEKYKSLHIPPRSYQLEDLKKLYQGAQDCTKAIYALVNPAPTGYGKTVFSAMLFSALRVRTLFLVPANILIGQTVNEFKKMIPDARVIAYESAYSFESVLNNNDVIVTTIQMLQFDGRYKDKFSKAMSVIGYVIFDEAHACISEARNHIVQMFMQMKCHALGLTATPLEEVYNAFGYFSDGRDNPIPRRSLIENINLGILPHVSLNMIDCPALYAKKSLAVATNSNTATTSTDMHLDNDDSPDDSDEDVEQSDSRIRNLLTDVYFNSADQLTNHFYFGMKGIIFVQRNADATELANHFNKIYQDNKQHPKIIKFEEEFQPGEDFHFAEAVHSNVDDCEKVIADFKANKIRVLIGVKMIAVGFDDKEVKFVALSQTNSHTHLVQSAGRGLRTPSTLMEMMDGHLVNYKTTHFVQVFLGNKKVKYFFNELKVTNNDKITVKFNHGLTENDINIHVLPAYPKIATQLDVEYKLRAQPTEADETLLRKLYRTEIHMIGGYPFTRDQLEKMPVHIRNILEVLEDQHKVIAIKLKNFDNVEVHTEHVLQKRSLDTSRADTSSKRSVVDDSERSDVVVPRITSAVRNQLVQKLDDVLDRFEEIHTETGNKKGQNGSSKSTGLKLSKKKIDLSQLLTYMLSRYKDLYQQLETFENELLLQGDAAQFKENLEKLIDAANEIAEPNANQAKNTDLPEFSRSDAVFRFFGKTKTITVKAFFEEYALDRVLKTHFYQARDLCFVLRKFTRAESILELEGVLAGIIKQLFKIDVRHSKLSEQRDELIQAVKADPKVDHSAHIANQEKLLVRLGDEKLSLCQLFAKAIQYLKPEPVCASKLLQQITSRVLLTHPNLSEVAAALLFASSVTQIAEIPTWSDSDTTKTIFKEVMQVTSNDCPIHQRLAYAYQYNLFYALQSLFYGSLKHNELVTVSLEDCQKYAVNVVAQTLSHLELIAILKTQLTSPLAQHVLEEMLRAHANKNESAYFIPVRKWPEALRFINAMLQRQFSIDPSVFPDLHLRIHLSNDELAQTRTESLRNEWLMLPQLAGLLVRYQRLSPEIVQYCKQRIMLLYLYMQQHHVLSDHLEKLLCQQLQNPQKRLDVHVNAYSSANFGRIFDTYIKLDPNCAVSDLRAIFGNVCSFRLPMKTATAEDLKLVIRHVLRQIAIVRPDNWWGYLANRLIEFCFKFTTSLAVDANDFIENYYAPLLQYANAYVPNLNEPNALPESDNQKVTFASYFSHAGSVRTPNSCSFANTLFVMLYSTVKVKIGFFECCALLSRFTESERSGLGTRLIALQEHLKLPAEVALYVFMDNWAHRTIRENQYINLEMLPALLHFYDQQPDHNTNLKFFAKKIVLYSGCIRHSTGFKSCLGPVRVEILFIDADTSLNVALLLLIALSSQLLVELFLVLDNQPKEIVVLQKVLPLLDVLSEMDALKKFRDFFALIKLHMNAISNFDDKQYAKDEIAKAFAEKIYSAILSMTEKLSLIYSDANIQLAPVLRCQYPKRGGKDLILDLTVQKLHQPNMKELVLTILEPSNFTYNKDQPKENRPQEEDDAQGADAIQEDPPAETHANLVLDRPVDPLAIDSVPESVPSWSEDPNSAFFRSSPQWFRNPDTNANLRLSNDDIDSLTF